VAVVLISIVPYAQTGIARDLDSFMVLVPALATWLAFIGFPVMRNEIDLLDKIRREYRKLQNTTFMALHNEGSEGPL
jgi:hypothetical protein